MALSQKTLRSLLEELDDWLVQEGCEPVEWVVCGGLALALQGFQYRTTKDVDVLGVWDTINIEVSRISSFPENVMRCIERVASDHPELQGLGPNWVNLGPARLTDWGLPRDYQKRLKTVKIGARLTLQLLGREDLLALKLYAAADIHGNRQAIHFGDLRDMEPTFEELDSAVDWIRTLPNFEETRSELNDVARRLGYDDLAYYI